MDTKGLRRVSILIFALVICATASSVMEPEATHDIVPNTLQQELSKILRDVGCASMAMMMSNYRFASSHSLVQRWKGSATLFAPLDEAFHVDDEGNGFPSWQYFSPDGLVDRHFVQGILAYADLARLPAGTNLRTLAGGSCVVVTAAAGGNRTRAAPVRVNGAAVARPDLFNDGVLAIHGVDRLLDSPSACTVRPPPAPPVWERFESPEAGGPSSLRAAIARLGDELGYGVAAMGLRLLSAAELRGPRNMTVFAVKDEAVFSGDRDFISEFRGHVVPDRRLLLADLAGESVLSTLEGGRSLRLSGAGNNASGPVVSVNNVTVVDADVFYNSLIAVHGIPRSLPFPSYFDDGVSSLSI